MKVVNALIAWALERRLVRSALLYTDRRGPMLADSVTYRALFSVFAGVLLGFWLAALWLAGNPDAWRALLRAVEAAVPGLLGKDGVITDLDSVPELPGLSIAGIASIVGLLGAALGAIGSLRTAVRTIAGTAMTDAMIVWVMLRNLLLAAGIAAAFAAAAALTVLGGTGVGVIADVVGIDPDSPLAAWGVRVVSLVVVFALDTALVIAVFLLLAGRRAPAKTLWSGALLGAVGLIILQELSGLFVSGARSNPLLASFAALLALLIWLNFSTQVILFACAYIVTGIEETEDRVRARYGARTLAEHAVRRAEREVGVAVAALAAARDAVGGGQSENAPGSRPEVRS
ncbi:YhjD/YihY/BrkB family envelope integrity protein [Microbacterium sp. NPDC055903]